MSAAWTNRLWPAALGLDNLILNGTDTCTWAGTTVEELATLFAGSVDAADERLSATAAACSGGDGAADPLQTLRALHFAIFATDAALRAALHSSTGSGSGGAAASRSSEVSNGSATAAPVAEARELQLIAHLQVLLTDAAAHVVAEIDRARNVGLLDGGTVAAAVALIGEEALWLGLCSQVRRLRRLAGNLVLCVFILD